MHLTGARHRFRIGADETSSYPRRFDRRLELRAEAQRPLAFRSKKGVVRTRVDPDEPRLVGLSERDGERQAVLGAGGRIEIDHDIAIGHHPPPCCWKSPNRKPNNAASLLSLRLAGALIQSNAR